MASGRVNLIGDHTDYMGGMAMPMTIDRYTTVEGECITGPTVELVSDTEGEPARFGVPVGDAAALEPQWARYPAAVAAELGCTTGFCGTVGSNMPVGAGLSSSAALEIATALALTACEGGTPADPLELARLCQRAEHRAVGLPSGLMDQLCIATGREGHATLIDFATLEVSHVPLPPEARVWVVHSGQQRRLESSAYAERRSCAERAAALVGPLPAAPPEAIEALEDSLLRRRARHVRTECDRVLRFAELLTAGDMEAAGAEMVASHVSLRDDYEVSTPALDALVEALLDAPGVLGARLTGAGFGGCVVALTSERFDLRALEGDRQGWLVRPVDGTEVTVT